MVLGSELPAPRQLLFQSGNAVLLLLQVGARLISHAGSLTNLAKYPASTVQILGAEKALFRYWGAPSLLGKAVAAVMAGRGRSRAG